MVTTQIWSCWRWGGRRGALLRCMEPQGNILLYFTMTWRWRDASAIAVLCLWRGQRHSYLVVRANVSKSKRSHLSYGIEHICWTMPCPVTPISLPNVGLVAMSNLHTDIFFNQRQMCYPKNVRSTRSGVRYVPLYDCCGLSAFCETTPRALVKNRWANFTHYSI